MYAHGIHDLACELSRWCQWSFPNAHWGINFGQQPNKKSVSLSLSRLCCRLSSLLSWCVYLFYENKWRPFLILTAVVCVCVLASWIDGDEWPNYGWFNVTKWAARVHKNDRTITVYWHSFFLDINKTEEDTTLSHTHFNGFKNSETKMA